MLWLEGWSAIIELRRNANYDHIGTNLACWLPQSMIVQNGARLQSSLLYSLESLFAHCCRWQI